MPRQSRRYFQKELDKLFARVGVAAFGVAVTEFYIKDNGLSVNYATLVMLFFGISAVFHFCAPPAPPEPDAPSDSLPIPLAGALIMGAFESCWFWYWRHACIQTQHTSLRLTCIGACQAT